MSTNEKAKAAREITDAFPATAPSTETQAPIDDGKIALRDGKTMLEVVREYFPEVSPEDADTILWSRTGFPAFWNGDDPETCLREQLKAYADAVGQGKDICYGCGKMFTPSAEGDDFCGACELNLRTGGEEIAVDGVPSRAEGDERAATKTD